MALALCAARWWASWKSPNPLACGADIAVAESGAASTILASPVAAVFTASGWPEWKPNRAKFVLVKTEGGRHLSACVDPGYPSAWRRSPYYENLKQWAAEGIRRSPNLHLVDVMVGSHCIVILPDRDVDIGILAPDEMIQLQSAGAGMAVEVQKVKCQPSAS